MKQVVLVALLRGEYDRPRRYALLGQAVANVGGRQQAKAARMILGGLPGEEDVAVGPRPANLSERE